MADTNTTPTTQSTPAPVSIFDAQSLGKMTLSPEGWTAFWAGIKAERAKGWKPDAAEQALLDAAYRAGKAAGLGRQSAPKAAKVGTASPEGTEKVRRSRRSRVEKLPAGQHVVLGVFHSPEGSLGAQRVYRRWFQNAPAAYEAVDITLEALRAQLDKAGTKTGTLTITVKDYVLNETWTMKVPVANEGKESYSFRQVAKLAPKAPPAAPKAAPQPRKVKVGGIETTPHIVRGKPVRYAKPVAAKPANGDVKAALKAALQGLAATQAAILAAVNAL